MSALHKRRWVPFRAQASELREIARTVKHFGLPGPSTDRAVEKIRKIAQEIEAAPEEREERNGARP